MRNTPQRAIIYVRVSSDKSGRGRSVAEQESECRAVCIREGWPVGEVISDNDRGASRHSRGERPGYDRLADILQPGDVLVTWEASRAQRDLLAYATLSNLCADRDVMWNYSGRTYDLKSGTDRFTTGLDALMAAREADQTQERVKRALEANAAQGKPHGKIPYGYRAVRDPQTGKIVDRVIDQAEAAIIHEIRDRLFAGETVHAITKDLNARGVRTVKPKKGVTKPRTAVAWPPSSIRRMMLSGYVVAERRLNGVVTPGNWEPILTKDEQVRLSAIINNPNRPKASRGTAPAHLLSGIAQCGVCRWPMYRGTTGSKKDVYRCSNTPSHTSRLLDKTDDVVIEKLFEAIENYRTDLFLRIEDDETVQPDDSDASKYLAEAAELRQRRDAFVDQGIAGTMSVDAVARAEAALLPLIEAAEEKARTAVVTSDPLLAIVNTPAPVMWKSFDLEQKRRFIRAAVDVVVLPAPNGERFNRDLIEVTWKT